MSFSERAKTIALAIVKIFETSKPFGDYTAVAVLNDGAGISYGTSQFTHKSGSLGAVLRRFVMLGGKLPDVVEDNLASFTAKTNIARLAGNKALKDALQRTGNNPLMQQAQREIAFENYLKKALQACEGSNFVLPLSLAVIYDSINHGSYAKIRDRVKITPPGNGSMKAIQFEKAWITEYVRKRDAWLESIPRLASTDYRTDFFLAQIARGNWNLDLPMSVHGFKLTEEILFPKGVPGEQTLPAAASANNGLPEAGYAKEFEAILPASKVSAAVPASTFPKAPDGTSHEPTVQQSPIETTITEVVQDSPVTTVVEQTHAAGHAPEVPPTQVSTGSRISNVLAWFGGAGAIASGVWSFISEHQTPATVGMVCGTIIVLAVLFRKAILDYLRMNTASDPNRYNVK